MDIGILYAIVAGVAMLVEGVVLNRILTTGYKDTIDRPLTKLLVFFMLFSFVDMTWGFLMSTEMIVYLPGYIGFTYAFHLCAALSAFFWAGYCERYMKLSGKPYLFLNVFRTVLLLVQLFIIISNLWNHKFFRIREDYVYESYSMRSVNFLIQFSYYVLLIFAAIIVLIKEKNLEGKERANNVIAFSVFPLAFGVGQVLWSDAPMYSLGFMVTSVMIYSFIVTKFREEFLSKTWKKENARLSAIASGLSEDFQAIYVVDLETNSYETYINDEIYGRKVVGDISDRDFFADYQSDFEKYVYPDDAGLVRSMLNKDHIIAELSTKKSFSFNYRRSINNNVRYYILKVIKPSAIEDSNKIIVGVFDDDERVHDEMEKNRQLRIAMEKAQSANRAKTSFLFSMSHDVRTPMNAIIGFADIAKRNMDNREKVEECVDKVLQSGQHLLALINDVLSMSRLEAGKEVVNEMPNSISRMVTQIVSILNCTAVAKNIKLEYEYLNCTNDYVYCDTTHVNQILINIISNAIKYTNEGGNVKLVVEQLESGADIVNYSFVVSDNGIGMSKEFQEHIFDEFAREQSSTMSGVEGTGLGMSIVKKLIDSMGGKIKIESEQNVGTQVTVLLSFEKCAASNVAEIQNSDIDYAGAKARIRGKRLLLVDDNELNREIARDTLEELELEVEEACDGKQAVDLILDKGEGYYDAVLMDVQMPVMDGYQATEAIRRFKNKELAKIPVIAITANAFDEDKQNAKNAGMNDHIVKPISLQKVFETLLKYL